MAFTKIVGAGIHTLSNVHTHNINSSGIITATQFVGVYSGTDGDFSGDVTIEGNLTVNGTTTTLDTNLTEVDKVEVAANNSTVGVAITQSGTGDILNLYDGSTEVFSVADGGASTFSGNVTVDAGANTTVDVIADSAGVAMVRTGGASGDQTTAAFELRQSTSSQQGGGISYNGDGSPGFVSGETADHTTFYRILNGSRYEVFSYPYNSDIVTFNSTVIAPLFQGNLTGTINTAAQTNITSIGTLGSLTVNGGSSPISFSHIGGNCVTFNRNGNTIALNANYAGQNNYAHIAITSGMDIRLQLGGADKITFKSNGDIRPVTDSQISLGSNALRFANLYVDEISASANISCVNLNPTGFLHIDDSTSGGHIYIGNNSDLKLFHNGTSNYIRSGADGHDILIDNNAGVVGAKFVPAGAVELNHNGYKKFETTTNGSRLLGAQQDLHGDVKFDNQTNSGMDLRWDESLNRLHFEQDNIKAVFGGTSDLEIYHDGSTNIINGLYHPIELRHQSEVHIKCVDDGAVSLYHDNVKSLETTAEGIEIEKTASGVHARLQIEATNGGQAGINLKTSKSGTNRASRIDYFNQDSTDPKWTLINDWDQNGDNEFSIRYSNSNKKAINILQDNRVDLYYNDNIVLRTGSDGLDVWAGSTNSHANIRLRPTGTGVYSTLNFYNSSGGSEASIGTHSGADQIYYVCPNHLFHIGGAYKLQMTGSAMIPYSASHPFDLGSSSSRFNNIYTNDLNLSNEGKTNDVDGTWGSYTIQEGEDDLFLINKRSGKKYKFNLTEVS